jgi:type III restriction enzyme
MADVLIENPILNSPFREPSRHFRFDDEGITNEVVEGRRSSSYFIPIARPKMKGKLRAFETEWTQDRIEENPTVNRFRQRVGLRRQGGDVGVTPTTARLLQYWSDPDRERKLFFCRVEAPETIIYFTECARSFGDAWVENGNRSRIEGDKRPEDIGPRTYVLDAPVHHTNGASLSASLF